MSKCRSSDELGDKSESSESPKRAYTIACTKIDATAKLQIIQALDSGQPKADIAREYSVHPQTVAYIYKQKESIIKKYTQKYNLLKEVCSFNLEQNLVEWFDQQYTSGNIITEDDLHDKAKDILKDLSQEFTCIDDWLLSFRARHNISKYTSDDIGGEKSKEDWKNFLKTSDTNDVYLCGVCALAHNLDVNNYLDGQNSNDYVSLFFVLNTLGTDKKELAVVGNDLLEMETAVKSLPVKYYHFVNTQVNFDIIHSYLTKWDGDLVAQGRSITLILNVPDNIVRKLQFYNIRLINTTHMNYTMSILEKIIECFKYNYRKLQITRSTTFGKDNCRFIDFIHMIGMAWNYVPNKLVQSLCFPPEHNGLYFRNDDEKYMHSMSMWCKTYNFTGNVVGKTEMLDNFIHYDKTFPCICNHLDDAGWQKPTEVLSQKPCTPTSAIEAYQAMKRLVSYLQGENAGSQVTRYAKYLENHIEYGALLQMHQFIASSNDNMLDE